MKEQLLALLRGHADEHLSGEQLSRELGCSRTAIWKHIEGLRKQGYVFEAISRRGYRLLQEPEKLDVDKIKRLLNTRIFGREIYYYDEVDSTQNLARLHIAEGAPEGAVVIAELQTAGRGRGGRSFYSPKGKGAWFSFVMKPNIPLTLASQLTLLCAVALNRAIHEVTGLSAGIKWPNDLLIHERKISGILLESSADDQRLHHVVAGLGISVNLVKEDYPEELLGIASSLRMESGHVVDREHMIAAVLNEIERLYELYISEGFDPIRLMWEAQSVSLGRPIQVRTSTGYIEGIASGIDEMGALLFTQSDGQFMKIYSGDVILKD